MEKNQNGEPRVRGERQGMTGGCQSGDRLGGNVGNSGNGGDGMGYGCRGAEDSPLGYATFPIQKFRLLYSADDALKHGTLFEELYLPMEVYNNGNKQ